MHKTAHERKQAVPDDGVAKLVTWSLESLQGLRQDGQPKHFAQLQGMVGAMIAIQAVGAIWIDAAAILKAWDALAAIQARHYDAAAREWRGRLTITAPEQANIENAIHHHGAQLFHLNQGEAIDAIRRSATWSQAEADRAVAKVRAQLNEAQHG